MKKKLLSESQVRRFMGLAGIKNINESYGMDEDMYEETLMEEEEDDMDVELDDAPAEEEPEAEMPEMEAGDADIEIEDEKITAAEQGLEAIQDLVSSLTGAMSGGDMPADDMGMMDKDEDEEDKELDDDLAGVDVPPSEEEEQEMEDEIVNEVARRVAKRIVEAKRAHKRMNEALGRKK